MTSDQDYIVAKLESAGRTLMALPGAGCWPSKFKSNWPEVVQEMLDAYGFSEEEQRAPRPTARQIGELDEVLPWLLMVRRNRTRRIVAARMLVHPITGKHVHSYRRLGKKNGVNHETAKAWFFEGISNIRWELRHEL